MELIDFLCMFLPGILSFCCFTKLMRGRLLLRAMLICFATCLLGVAAGFVIEHFYGRHKSPPPDLTYHWAYRMGMIQLAIGSIVGLFSLMCYETKVISGNAKNADTARKPS